MWDFIAGALWIICVITIAIAYAWLIGITSNISEIEKKLDKIEAQKNKRVHKTPVKKFYTKD